MSPSFQSASHFVINGATFNDRITGLQDFLQHTVPSATHDSRGQDAKPKCHPDTRKKLLSDIHEWIKVRDKVTGISYLHGPAGSGKSCIARSVCAQAAKEGLLGASFFFWRNSSSRNNESQLVTTLAYQLAEKNAVLKDHILSALANDPRVVTMPLDVQFQKLILEPCRMVPREELSLQVIVIDGLDECIGEAIQIGILRMLAKAVRSDGFPLGFFITSRPEIHLQEALDSKEVTFATNVISLNSTPAVSQDIRTVLESGFIGILNNPRFRRAMKSVPRPWPTPESIDKLVLRSSGQFIYSSTVLDFISNPNSSPAAQLDIVLGIRDAEGSSPLAALDLLYCEIMSRVEYPDMTLKVLSYIMAIKSLSRKKVFKNQIFPSSITKAVLYNHNRLLPIVEQLQGLPDGMAYSALNQLHSLVSLKASSESTRRRLTIDFYHKSFEDFLTTKNRSLDMFVDIDKTNVELCHSCLNFMAHPKYDTVAEHVGWLYSSFQWSVHIKYGRTIGPSNLRLDSHDEALRRFTSGMTDYLNVPNLDKALQTLGLIGNPWTELYSNIQKFGTFSLQDRLHVVKDVRVSMGSPTPSASNCPTHPELKKFNELYGYPALLEVLLSYNYDPQSTKLCISVFYLSGAFLGGDSYQFSDRETCTLFSALGLISDESEQESVVSQYKIIVQEVQSFMFPMEDLQYFIVTSISAELRSDVCAAIISTGVWRNHMERICFQWSWREEVTATRSLLSCLKSEALEFYDNLELNKTLDREIEHDLFVWLREKLRGPTEDVIKSWEEAFAKAHSLFPENFVKRSRRKVSTKRMDAEEE